MNITFACNIVFPFESAFLGAACPVQREIGDREEPGASDSHKQDSELDSHKRDMAKGTCQKLLSGFFPLRGGRGVPPFSAKEKLQNYFPLRGEARI